MQYISTRDKNTTYLASQASPGLAPDGGLMTPAYLPKLPGKSPVLTEGRCPISSGRSIS